MKVALSAKHALHDPQLFLVRGRIQRSAEQPERVTRLLHGLEQLGLTTSEPADFGAAPIAAIHTPAYLTFLEEAHALWQNLGDSSAEVLPNVHPFPQQSATYPTGIVGRAGFHMADTACPIGPGTHAAALSAAHSACQAAQWLIEGESASYALCRPPGHHAYAERAGGFCFLNNAAIAAQLLRSRHQRVAILDIDVHHGNGTQGIFYRRADVLTVSLHADPSAFYPFFVGYGHERGDEAGLGYNLNLPLPHGSGDRPYLATLAQAIREIRSFSPGALVVALGLDAYEGDPLKGLAVTTQGFSKIGAAIAELGLPSVLIQEGGYLSPELGGNLRSFLAGFLGKT